MVFPASIFLPLKSFFPTCGLSATLFPPFLGTVVYSVSPSAGLCFFYSADPFSERVRFLSSLVFFFFFFQTRIVSRTHRFPLHCPIFPTAMKDHPSLDQVFVFFFFQANLSPPPSFRVMFSPFLNPTHFPLVAIFFSFPYTPGFSGPCPEFLLRKPTCAHLNCLRCQNSFLILWSFFVGSFVLDFHLLFLPPAGHRLAHLLSSYQYFSSLPPAITLFLSFCEYGDFPNSHIPPMTIFPAF